MRRLMIVAALVGLTGCSNLKEMFSANADMAARAGELELSAERLGELLVGPKGMRPNREAAQFVANVWVDYALFAQGVANGTLPTDSAAIADAMWPEIAELRGTHWHDTLTMLRADIPEGAAAELYRGDSVRVLQHILFGVPQSATPEVRAEAKREATQTLAKIRRGADFGELAAQLSDDPGSKADNGFLPPTPRGRFVAAFDSVGWTLEPGAVSGLVETPFGYHIIRRPPMDAVLDRLHTYIAQSAGMRLDSIYMDSLALTKNVEVRSDAPATMRSAVENPEAYRRATTKLVTYDGGALTVQNYLRWVRALPPAYTGQLRSADDSMLSQFARVLTQNVLLLEQADSAGITLTPAQWTGLSERYTSSLDTLRVEMGLGDATDSSATESERTSVAGMKVQQYFDRIVAREARMLPLPSALGQVLRERSEYRINEAGLDRAVEIAEAAVAKRDSAQGGALQQAPGGPPVPNQGASTPPDSASDAGSGKEE